MTQANSDRYCHHCHRTLIQGDDPHNNFCSWSCQNKYMMERAKWERLKQEKENARADTKS